MNLKKYIFDVDGTLTPSRKQIDHSFWAFFLKFCCSNDVYLVTGSNREKTVEQLGLDICYRAKRVYNCSGSDVYERDVNVYRDDWELPKDVERFLEDELAYSCFPIRNGNHIERRPGGINFSILGRDKDPMLGREEYIKWDKERLEREDIADRIRNHFPELNVQVGGQTGLDISNKDKSQILRDFSKGDDVHFFGDMIEKGQNDYPLGVKVIGRGGNSYNVESWKHTWELLNKE